MSRGEKVWKKTQRVMSWNAYKYIGRRFAFNEL